MSAQPPEMENEISSTSLTGPNLIFRRTTFSKSTLQKLTITTSILTTCTISNSTINSSTLKSCALSNCAISNSTLVDCQLIDSTLHESPFVKSKLAGCQVTTSLLTLRKLPYELRGMIFEKCLMIEGAKSPALLIAIRGDKELYEQALEIYYRINYFTLTAGKDEDKQLKKLQGLSQRALSGIKMLRIDHPIRASLSLDVTDFMKEKTAIRTIIVTGDSVTCVRISAGCLIRNLKTISKVYVQLRGLQKSSARLFEQRFGFKGQQIQTAIHGVTDLCCWEAEKGEVLTWTQR